MQKIAKLILSGASFKEADLLFPWIGRQSVKGAI